MSDWNQLRDEILADPEVREEYERLRPHYALASCRIALRKLLGLCQR